MTKDDFRAAADAIRDLRFIQAAAVVGAKLGDEKKAKAYMALLNKLQQKLEAEAMK